MSAADGPQEAPRPEVEHEELCAARALGSVLGPRATLLVRPRRSRCGKQVSVCHTVGATLEVVVWIQRYEEVDVVPVKVPFVVVDHLWPALLDSMVYRSCQ